MYEKYKKQKDLIDDDVFDRAVNLVRTNGGSNSLGAQKNAALDAYLNRGDFKYDINTDALYNQYKDKYIQQGQQAMQDTMGQAAALTGGYGSSYAQNVGQQAYNSHLQQLNEVVPELYRMAYDRYKDEGDELLQRYALLSDEEREAYARQYQERRDAVADSQWQQGFDENKRQYDQNFSYQQERDAVADSQWQQGFDENKRQYDQNFSYQQERDAVADSQWQQGYDYQKERDAVADSQWQQGYDYQKERDAVADSQWQQGFDENKRQYDQNFSYQQEPEAESYTYAYTDPETNRAHYYTADGKEVEFDKGINPYTGDPAEYSEQGTIGAAGYQSGKIKIGDEYYEAKDMGVYDNDGEDVRVYSANGELYTWSDTKGKYVPYEGYVGTNSDRMQLFRDTIGEGKMENGDIDWAYKTGTESHQKGHLRNKIVQWAKDGKLTENEAACLMLEYVLSDEE